MGARFVTDTNNGVTALMPVEWYERIYETDEFVDADVNAIDWSTAIQKGLCIFTFCSARRLIRNPREMRYFTGTSEDMEPLLRNLGSDFSELFPKSFLVPFSNGWGNMRLEHAFALSHDGLVYWFGSNAETAVL